MLRIHLCNGKGILCSRERAVESAQERKTKNCERELIEPEVHYMDVYAFI